MGLQKAGRSKPSTGCIPSMDIQSWTKGRMLLPHWSSVRLVRGWRRDWKWPFLGWHQLQEAPKEASRPELSPQQMSHLESQMEWSLERVSICAPGWKKHEILKVPFYIQLWPKLRSSPMRSSMEMRTVDRTWSPPLPWNWLDNIGISILGWWSLSSTSSILPSKPWC